MKTLQPFLTKNDKKAKWIILGFSAIIFLVITMLGKYTVKIDLPFDSHLFAKVNAYINATVAFLLVLALWAVKTKKIALHKQAMLAAMFLSILFLLSYVCHHLLTDETKFPETGTIKVVYYFLLLTHILLAGISLPFILFTAYRAAIGEYSVHKKMARYTWPMWFYVAVTGVIVYVMISPYYT
jgi:putative membrane protein